MSVLNSKFPNGPFGDPALLLWEGKNRKRHALLFDCGDLSRFTNREILKVTHLFISHAHMDHLFGFDLLLRVHMGKVKTMQIVGPPETSKHIGGKLQGYTWNLTQDHDLNFEVTDLAPVAKQKTITLFKASDQFNPSSVRVEAWDLEIPVAKTALWEVRAAFLDHRTPSIAYTISQNPYFYVDISAIQAMGLSPGPWINEIKKIGLHQKNYLPTVRVSTEEGAIRDLETEWLADQILRSGHQYKIAYVTDGAASVENKNTLLNFVKDADLLYSETCFLSEDEAAAIETKHFTAKFIGRLAKETGVKRLAPFHFSKRYLGKAEKIIAEIRSEFPGEITLVKQEAVQARF